MAAGGASAPTSASMYRCYSRLINRKSCANYRPAITFPQFSLSSFPPPFPLFLFSKIVGTLVRSDIRTDNAHGGRPQWARHIICARLR